jgi:hypothetical protein
MTLPSITPPVQDLPGLEEEPAWAADAVGAAAPAGRPLVELATEDTEPEEVRVAGRLMRVVLEEGDGLRAFEVRVDNRDYLRFDKSRTRLKLPAAVDATFVFATFLAWSAGSRAGHHDLSWPAFEATCVDVGNVAEEDTDAAARPTR